MTPPTFETPCVQSPLAHAYSYIHQIGRSAKSMNLKDTKKSPIHENADANITCDFGDDDISRLGVANHLHTSTNIQTSSVGRLFVSWIIVR